MFESLVSLTHTLEVMLFCRKVLLPDFVVMFIAGVLAVDADTMVLFVKVLLLAPDWIDIGVDDVLVALVELMVLLENILYAEFEFTKTTPWSWTVLLAVKTLFEILFEFVLVCSCRAFPVVAVALLKEMMLLLELD